MQPSIDITQPLNGQLKAIACLFPDSSFVPCVHNSRGQKPPCKEATNWVSGWIHLKNLDNFDYKCLGLLLGTKYLAIDCDGKSAINLLAGLLQTCGELPETLKLASNLGVRECLIFKISSPLVAKSLHTANKEQLEFRTGNQYQIVGGLHPSGSVYLTNNAEIAELPATWYDYLNNTLDNFIPETSEQMQMWTLLEKLRKLDDFFGIDYDSWLRIGMIVHSVDDTEKGLELWSTWSKKFPGYEDTEDEEYSRKWYNFNADKDNVLTIGSLYYFLSEKTTLTEETETLVKQLDEVVEKDIVTVLEKEAAQYKAMFLTHQQIPMFASKVVQKVLKHSDRYYIDYVISYLSEDSITQQDAEVTRKSLETLYRADKALLDVDFILDDTRLSYCLGHHADTNNIPKEYLFLAFLTTFSAVLSKNFTYNFNSTTNIIPTLFTLFIGEATSGKSAIVAPFMKPLQDIANHRHNKFKKEWQDYETACEEWKKLSKEQQHETYLQVTQQYDTTEDITTIKKRDAVIPEPKRKNPFLITDASFEALKELSGKFKDFGLLIAPDEITGFLQTINQITKQKDGLDRLIPVWNGETTLRNRVTGELEDADFFQVAVLSGIQTDRLSKFFDLQDPSGITSRFLMIPIEQINIPTRVNQSNDTPILSAIAEQIFEETQQKICFTLENKMVVRHDETVLNLWGDWRLEQDDRSEKVKDINKGFAQWLRRNPLYTARIALCIHALRYVEGLEPNLSLMSVDSMKRAIMISRWLTQKAQINFNQSLIGDLEKINPGKVKIFKDLLRACKGEPKKVSFFSNHSLGRRNDLKDAYAAKADPYLKKSGIVALFQDAAKHGVGVFDASKGVFSPNNLD